MKNYYDILGVAGNATTGEIQDAFRKLAQKFHPDKNPDDPYFAGRFKEINEARKILCDDLERAVFDMQLLEYNDAYEMLKNEQRQEMEKRQSRRQVYLRSGDTGKRTWVLGGSIAIVAAVIMIWLATSNNLFNDDEQQFVLGQSDRQVDRPNEILTREQPAQEAITQARVNVEDLDKTGTNIINRQPSATRKVNTLPVTPNKNRMPGFSTQVVATHDTLQGAIIERTLTDTEEKAIIQQLHAEKSARCVQLLQTSTSNIKKDFSIATVLQRNGYIISGRGITSAEIQGAQVNRAGNCLQLIIGSFN